MKSWVVLFRGINVGSTRKVPMKELSALLEQAGFSDVKTYIQSGNVLLRSTLGKAQEVADVISAAFAKQFTFTPKILVLALTELEKAVAANPFSHAEANHKTLHFYFLSETPKQPNLGELNKIKTASENYAIKGKVFYLHVPEYFGTSKLAEKAEKLIGVDATARNWRTVSNMLELAKEYR